VRNVFMENCEFDGTDRAVRIKSRADRGGVVERIYARNLKVKDVKREVVIMNMDYGSDRSQILTNQPPVFRDMLIENIVGNGAPTAILLTGMAESPIANIRFRNMTIQSTRGVVASHVTGLIFDNVQVTPTTGPVFKLTDAAEIQVRGSVAPRGTDCFLELAGESSRDVILDSCDLSEAKEPYAVATGVSSEEVRIK
jgi:hypothetical protein